MEVSALSRVVMSPKLNLYPLDYRAAFAFSMLPYPQFHRLALRLAFPQMRSGLTQGELRAYRVSCERQSGLGLASLPVAQTSASGDSTAPEPGHVPFWSKPLPVGKQVLSIFGLLCITAFISDSLCVDLITRS